MNNTKRTLVVMAGLPAAGKTTIASALAKKLNWQVVDKDKYRIELIRLGEDNDSASDAAYRRSFREIRTLLLEEGKSVIFDSPALWQKTIDNIFDIVANHEIRLKIILCIVNRDLRYKRLVNRKELVSKEQDELYTREFYDPLTDNDYRQCFIHLPNDKYELFTSNSPQICAEEAEKYIQSENS